MIKKLNGKLKIIIVFGVLFAVLVTLLGFIFFAGKKTYTVRFELNGGTLISGSLEQHITQGQNATLPNVVKDGAYLHSWSASHQRITKDMVIEAVWEYKTTPGIIYTNSSNQNFTEIEGAYEYLRGEVYLGAFFGEKKVLGIRPNAFEGHADITKVYLLDGLLNIGSSAFLDCTGLTEIEIPETVTHIGSSAFKNCTSLEKIILNEGLLELGANAFSGCTALKEIVLPESLATVGRNTFDGCEDLVITVKYNDEKIYDGWSAGWEGDATVNWPPNLEAEEPLPPIIIRPDRPIKPSLDLENIFKDKIEIGTGLQKEDTDTDTGSEIQIESETENDVIDKLFNGNDFAQQLEKAFERPRNKEELTICI